MVVAFREAQGLLPSPYLSHVLSVCRTSKPCLRNPPPGSFWKLHAVVLDSCRTRMNGLQDFLG